MNTQTNPSDDNKPSLFPKLFFTAILILVSAIPSMFIQDLIAGRESTREDAMVEVAEKWGGSQTVSGPMLVVPYVDGENLAYAYFLPEKLSIDGNVETEMRARGIYDISVYDSELSLTGNFLKPDFGNLNIEKGAVHWDEAYLAVGLSDLKGLEKEIQLDWGGTTSVLTQQTTEGFGNAMTQKISGLSSANSALNFKIDLSFKGSNELYFTPVGETTTVNLTSNWTAPSFNGVFLPESHEILNSGFTATWNIFYLNRNYPQAWLGDEFSISESEAGVDFFIPADAYHMTTRAVKYMMLFVFLTFFVFFFVEIMNKQKLHPVQYLLVGFALIIFYLLLLSLSEHIGFAWAYLLAAISIVGVIGSYSRSILGSKKLALFISSFMAALYLVLYIILQLSDYALLIGSLLLFVALTVTMYATRKVDWYNFR
ncbi:MAG: cell envelope integrity protein CreD [Candidatus Gracilibacteria bacterium]